MARYPITVIGLLALALMSRPGAAWAQTTEDLFSSPNLQRVDLWVHSADWEKLKANFQENTYYPADFVWNGQTVRNVGIRSRGRGSRSGVKPGLRVDFDRYAADQTFLGVKSLVLDNLTQDESGVHETVAMAFYARLGIPAPREIHARLYVNHAYVGLYVIVESVDKDLLARVFGAIDDDTQNDGTLFEFTYQDGWRFEYLGGSLEPYVLRFDATTHESRSDEENYRPIETLVRLTNESTVSGLAESIGGLLDIPAFIRFVAAQNFVAETDGFLGGWGINNFYLYRLENQTVHTLIAWDADVSFWGPDLSITEGWGGNVLMEKLMSVPEYNALYVEEIARAVTSAETDGWLDAEIRLQIERIDTAMREDPVKPYSEATYESKADAMLRFATERIAFVKCELANGVGRCRS